MGSLVNYERTPEVEFAFNALVDNALSSTNNQVFSFNELQQIAGGITREQLYQMTRRVNKIIIPKKRMYLNVRNNGYKIATAKEQLDHSDKRRIRSMRQTKWAIGQLDNLKIENLTKEEKDRHTLLTTILHNSLDCARKRTLSGLKNSKKSVVHQEAALSYIEIMKNQLDEFSKKLAAAV